jgi:hypothetical protein
MPERRKIKFILITGHGFSFARNNHDSVLYRYSDLRYKRLACIIEELSVKGSVVLSPACALLGFHVHPRKTLKMQ